jgi:hypothetical protein
MNKHHMSSEFHEILSILKKLPEEDRLILGLYLYEKLTAEQVRTVLNGKKDSARSEHPQNAR